MTKVLIIGLDGCTWDLVKPWIDDGELPTFKKLMTEGVWGELESTFPPVTCPAWPSMLTGKSPDRMGLYCFGVELSTWANQLPCELSLKASLRGKN